MPRSPLWLALTVEKKPNISWQSGPSEVIQPEIEAAGTVIRHVLELLGLPKEPVLDYLEGFRETGRSNGVTRL